MNMNRRGFFGAIAAGSLCRGELRISRKRNEQGDTYGLMFRLSDDPIARRRQLHTVARHLENLAEEMRQRASLREEWGAGQETEGCVPPPSV